MVFDALGLRDTLEPLYTIVREVRLYCGEKSVENFDVAGSEGAQRTKDALILQPRFGWNGPCVDSVHRVRQNKRCHFASC